MGRKVGFAAVYADITRRGALPEEASIHTAEMTAMRMIQKNKSNIYRLAELNADYLEQQRKLSNATSDIWHTSRTPWEIKQMKKQTEQ